MAQIRLITIPRPQPGTSTSPRTSKPQQAPATLLKSPPHQSSITEECAKGESAAQVIVTYTTISEQQQVQRQGSHRLFTAMTSTSTARPSPLPPDAHPARQTLAAATIPISRHRPQGLASSHRRKTQASSFFPERVV